MDRAPKPDFLHDLAIVTGVPAQDIYRMSLRSALQTMNGEIGLAARFSGCSRSNGQTNVGVPSVQSTVVAAYRKTRSNIFDERGACPGAWCAQNTI